MLGQLAFAINELAGSVLIAEIREKNMTVFWLHGEELMFGGNAVHPVQQRIPQMKMMKVHIPFTFKLHETSNSSYSGA
ncbi:cell growth regulator with RING finger domain protein 1 isoform X2 [Aphis craccivora]|uniref:Cell growth regulator with RING finger domain protein 1 isoform X2 n=1 Tax=Aphis craccivora TaxID=307492 RepID=A0A6G0ZA52_APHCR|nr:cell growth regulator with RING finger domain protein 1 isoform X2 [Aphis craccivora]